MRSQAKKPRPKELQQRVDPVFTFSSNVSRPYLVKLLNEEQIPCRTVGKYRRVRFDDLIAYKRKDDDARAKILDQLTAEAQELGMGY